MRFFELPPKAPILISVLLALIGVAPNRRADFQKSLRARPIFPMVVILIVIRFRRLFGKLVVAPAKGAVWSNESSIRNDGGAIGTGDESNVAASPAARREGRVPPLPRAPSDRSFPKLIFQTWKSKLSMPENYARWSKSLRQMNQDFEYFLWDDVDNRSFIERFYPWFLPFYDAYPREIYRADAVRYFFLYQFGGLYADMDTECLRPVGDLFRSGDVWLVRIGNDPHFPHSIPNAIMASRPLQEFWLLVIHLMVEKAKALGDSAAMVGKGPEALTGPMLLKTAYDTYIAPEQNDVRKIIQRIAARLPGERQPHAMPSRVVMLEPDIWYPIDWSNMIHLRLSSEVVDFNVSLAKRTKRWLFPKSFLVTYWTHSWKLPPRN